MVERFSELIDVISNKDIFDKVARALGKIDYRNVLVHSDIFYGFKFNTTFSKQHLLQAHWLTLNELFEGRKVCMPAFNYDFPDTKFFDTKNSKSQVGVLPEYFRTNIATWRSPVPMFSFSGEGEAPPLLQTEIIDPFDEHSFFNWLTENDGLIMHYGANIGCATILHYCERISGLLCYRYDKFFEGKVCDEKNNIQNVTLKYHVRPKNNILQYNWALIGKELAESGLSYSYKADKFEISFMKADMLVSYLISKMKTDRLSLLDEETRNWVIPKLDTLGRAFQLSDFE